METGSNNLVKLGTIGEARGLRGEVWLRIPSKDPEFLERLETKTFHIKTNDKELNLKPERIRVLFNKVCCQFEGVDNRTFVEPLKGSPIFLEADVFDTQSGETIFLNEVLGFQVINVAAAVPEPIGTVESFDSNGPQDLLVVKREGQEILIPFVKAFISKIDFASKKILMSLPEGLVDISIEN